MVVGRKGNFRNSGAAQGKVLERFHAREVGVLYGSAILGVNADIIVLIVGVDAYLGALGGGGREKCVHRGEGILREGAVAAPVDIDGVAACLGGYGELDSLAADGSLERCDAVLRESGREDIGCLHHFCSDKLGICGVRHLAVDGLAFRRSEETDHALVVGVVGAFGEGFAGKGLPGVLSGGAVDFEVLVAEVEARAFRRDGHDSLRSVDIVVFIEAVAVGHRGECEGVVVEFEHLYHVRFREDEVGDIVVGDVEGLELVHVVEIESRDSVVAKVEIFHIVGILEGQFLEFVVGEVEVADHAD